LLIAPCAPNQTGFVVPKHGNLTEWADQGVLLLNTTLTVNQADANSHSKFGWTNFTDAVITAVSNISIPIYLYIGC
jgi:uracil-DNA glycosylase